VALALDVAARVLQKRSVCLRPAHAPTDFIEYMARLVDQYPIVSIEDGLQEDWQHGSC